MTSATLFSLNSINLSYALPPRWVVLFFHPRLPSGGSAAQARGLHDGLHRRHRLAAPGDVHIGAAGAVQQIPGIVGQQLLIGVIHQRQLLQAVRQIIVLPGQPSGGRLADLVRAKARIHASAAA